MVIYYRLVSIIFLLILLSCTHITVHGTDSKQNVREGVITDIEVYDLSPSVVIDEVANKIAQKVNNAPCRVFFYSKDSLSVENQGRSLFLTSLSNRLIPIKRQEMSENIKLTQSKNEKKPKDNQENEKIGFAINDLVCYKYGNEYYIHFPAFSILSVQEKGVINRPDKENEKEPKDNQENKLYNNHKIIYALRDKISTFSLVMEKIPRLGYSDLPDLASIVMDYLQEDKDIKNLVSVICYADKEDESIDGFIAAKEAYQSDQEIDPYIFSEVSGSLYYHTLRIEKFFKFFLADTDNKEEAKKLKKKGSGFFLLPLEKRENYQCVLKEGLDGFNKQPPEEIIKDPKDSFFYNGFLINNVLKNKNIALDQNLKSIAKKIEINEGLETFCDVLFVRKNVVEINSFLFIAAYYGKGELVHCLIGYFLDVYAVYNFLGGYDLLIHENNSLEDVVPIEQWIKSLTNSQEESYKRNICCILGVKNLLKFFVGKIAEECDCDAFCNIYTCFKAYDQEKGAKLAKSFCRKLPIWVWVINISDWNDKKKKKYEKVFLIFKKEKEIATSFYEEIGSNKLINILKVALSFEAYDQSKGTRFTQDLDEVLSITESINILQKKRKEVKKKGDLLCRKFCLENMQDLLLYRILKMKNWDAFYNIYTYFKAYDQEEGAKLAKSFCRKLPIWEWLRILCDWEKDNDGVYKRVCNIISKEKEIFSFLYTFIKKYKKWKELYVVSKCFIDLFSKDHEIFRWLLDCLPDWKTLDWESDIGKYIFKIYLNLKPENQINAFLLAAFKQNEHKIDCIVIEEARVPNSPLLNEMKNVVINNTDVLFGYMTRRTTLRKDLIAFLVEKKAQNAIDSIEKKCLDGKIIVKGESKNIYDMLRMKVHGQTGGNKVVLKLEKKYIYIDKISAYVRKKHIFILLLLGVVLVVGGYIILKLIKHKYFSQTVTLERSVGRPTRHKC